MQNNNRTQLDKYNNSGYKPGFFFKRAIWYLMNVIFFKNNINLINSLKIVVLKLFGAKIGKDVIIKPGVSIKYPWKLQVGNNVWIGEGVWIDNLGNVSIDDNVCLSQGAMLLCGNHNYKKSTFDLLIGDIYIEEGVWIGARAILGPGIKCRSHAVLTVGSVANSDLDPFTIYTGNPARQIRKRKIDS